MSIRVELTPEEEARLRDRAQRSNKTPEAYVSDMVRVVLTETESESPGVLLPVVDEAGTFHQDRWEKLIASIEANGSAPVLPPEALTREAMHSDHD